MLIKDKLDEFIPQFKPSDIKRTKQLLETLKSQVGDLPKDYELFLLEFGFGIDYFTNNICFDAKYPSSDGDDPEGFGICSFFGLDGKDNLFEAREYPPEDFEDIIADWLIIGRDEFSNLLLMSLNGENRGKIWFWIHDHYVDDETEEIDGLFLIADSFAEFILNAYEYVVPYEE